MSTDETNIHVLLSHQVGTRRLLKSSITKEIADELTNSLNAILQSNRLSPENLIYIVTNLMNIAGRYKILKGREKKELVIILINKAIDESQLKDNVKSTLKIMLQNIVPNAIDVIVDVSKGKYKFKYLPKIARWFKNCKCC